MLKSLSIKNFILIEDIEIKFGNRFSVLTGETGAGKSILIGAVSLILGKRADASVLTDKSKKCIIEAEFDISSMNLNLFFEKNDIDYDDNAIIRREINQSGKSRAFINDSPVVLAEVKELTEKLIDLHSQHENLELNVTGYRTALIDSMSGTINISKDYVKKYNNYLKLNTELSELKEKLAQAKKDTDYYQFQIEQIEALKLKDANELSELEISSNELGNAEEIKTALQNALMFLNNDENSAEQFIKNSRSLIRNIESTYKNAETLLARIESVIIEISDICDEINIDQERIEINPSLLEQLNQRIDAINDLIKKHNCNDITELIKICENFKEKIYCTEELEEAVNDSQKKIDNILSDLKQSANELSKKREKNFPIIEKSVRETLAELGMPNASFKVSNCKSTELTQNGFDNIEFLFSANKNVTAQSLDKVASGGELSRLMLTIKSMLAKGLDLPTIIFDEIDTGVSGEIADKMGVIMENIASERQVISITHLPQIAAKGNEHFKVYKDESGNKTISFVKKLNHEQRINEIAAMISGSKTSPQALETAKVLLIK
jgi:DNA repair protein RecN (Recombination protein N)